jgi:hypothetical protein
MPDNYIGVAEVSITVDAVPTSGTNPDTSDGGILMLALFAGASSLALLASRKATRR